MAANSADMFTKVGSPGTATTLAAPGHVIGGTSITVVSTTNWGTDTGVIFAMDTVTLVGGVEVRDTGSYTEWEAVVSAATSITSMVLRQGTDQNYPAGSTTRVYIPVASSRENRVVDGILVEHDQEGTHTAITADSLVVADGGNIEVDHILEAASAHGVVVDGLTIKDGKLATNDSVVATNLTAGIVSNAKLDTTAGELGGVWTTLDPTINSINLGTGGTKYSRYMRIGKTIIFAGKFTLGTGGSLTGTVSFNLPVAAANNNVDFMGSAFFNDAGTGYYGAVSKILAGQSNVTFFNGGNSTAQPGGTVPFTWTVNDNLEFTIVYETA